MELPSVFSQHDSARYLALILTDSTVQAVLWRADKTGVQVEKVSDIQTYTNQRDCSIKADIALQDLGKESEKVNEIVFAVSVSWTNQQGIVNERKQLLKQLLSDLSLKALGFVVTVEALTQHVLRQDAHFSGLLIEFGTIQLAISLLLNGKLKATELVGRSGNTPADVAEALARLRPTQGSEVMLPGKIVLFSAEFSEEELITEEQTLLNPDWLTKQPFIHLPTTELIRPDQLVAAVVVEGGRAVAQAKGMKLPEPEAMVGAAAGEVSDMAIAPTTESETNLEGFTEVPPPEDDSDEPSSSKVSLLRKLSPRTIRSLVIGLVAGVIVILLLLVGYLYFGSRAEVVVTLPQQTVTEEVTLTLDPQASSSDPNQLILATRPSTIDVTTSQSVPATGAKVIGDKATGTVTIFNKTEASKTFETGTQLKSGRLVFTLDQAVTIASASVTTSSGSETKTFGRADGAVTAVAIGTESNLPTNTEFTLGDFSSDTYSATNENVFTGGTSREIRVIAAADREKLLAQARSDLMAKAQAELQERSTDGQFYIASGRMTLTKQDFDGQVGDEAESLSATITGTVEAYSYTKDDISPLAEAALTSRLTSGFRLVPNSASIMSSPLDQPASGSAQVKLVANLSAKAVPEFDSAAWLPRLADQSPQAAESLLKAELKAPEVVIAYQPALARILRPTLPGENRLVVREAEL